MQTGEVDEGKKEIAASQSLMQQNLRHDQNQLSDYLQTKQSLAGRVSHRARDADDRRRQNRRSRRRPPGG